jgi:hypothetical protein
VAILARDAEPVLTRTMLPGDGTDAQRRYIEAVVRGVLVASLYAPNGNPLPGPKFAAAAPRPVEIIKRTNASFVVQPKRWVIERTFAWACINRRLASDVERAAATVKALFQIAMIKLMARRIARYRDF